MPEPGDLIEDSARSRDVAFGWVYSRQFQADHCREEPARKGVWSDVKGKSWYFEACREHAPT